jgi:hypothetical protein
MEVRKVYDGEIEIFMLVKKLSLSQRKKILISYIEPLGEVRYITM